jgi:hypothetical protein
MQRRKETRFFGKFTYFCVILRKFTDKKNKFPSGTGALKN